MLVLEELRRAGATLATFAFVFVVVLIAIPPILAAAGWWWRIWVE